MMELKDWITGVTIPVISVFLGSFISYGTLRYQKYTDDIEQRKKVLRLVKKEVDMNMGIEKGYFSNRLRTGNMILENAIFDIERYERLIELTFDVMRKFDQLQIALDTMINTNSSIMSHVSTPTISNVLSHGVSKVLGIPTVQETAATVLPEQMGNQINNDMRRIRKVLEGLRKEIDKEIDELSKPIPFLVKIKIALIGKGM